MMYKEEELLTEFNSIDQEDYLTLAKRNWKKLNLLKLYADEQKEQYAYQQAMAYEEWLCENGYTKTISARPDYLDFFNQQK